MDRILLILSFCLVSIYQAKASPCCGQSSSSLSVMTQRQKLNLMVSQSQARALGRVFNSSDEFYVWQDSKERVSNITQMSLSYKISERMQTFFNTAFQQNYYKDGGFKDSDRNMMDTSLGLTYEILPEYSFSYYKPTVYLTVFTNLPTGKSVFEGGSGSENIGVSGHGQWGLGLGITAQKIILPWSVLVQVKSLRLFKENFVNAEVEGFFDSSAQVTLGYALNYWGLNLSLGLMQLELSQRQVRFEDRILVPNSRSTMINFGVMKPVSESLVIAVNYSDQSLLGRAKNTLLAQAVSFSLAYSYF